MASIRKEIRVNAPAAQVWAAVRDFGAVHERLVPGFVVDVQPEPGARVVTFANGTVARELLVDCDDEARRLVYSARSERVQHHNASVQVVPEGDLHCRMVWVADVLPRELAGYLAGQMTIAADVMQRTLAGAAAGRPARSA